MLTLAQAANFMEGNTRVYGYQASKGVALAYTGYISQVTKMHDCYVATIRPFGTKDTQPPKQTINLDNLFISYEEMSEAISNDTGFL